MASRSAIACSSGPPWTLICCSAAAVSDTAVFSVSVANCSRCASCTDSAWLRGELLQALDQFVGVAPERKAHASAFTHALSLAAATLTAAAACSSPRRRPRAARPRRPRSASPLRTASRGPPSASSSLRTAAPTSSRCSVEATRGGVPIARSSSSTAASASSRPAGFSVSRRPTSLERELVQLAAAGAVLGDLAQRDQDAASRTALGRRPAHPPRRATASRSRRRPRGRRRGRRAGPPTRRRSRRRAPRPRSRAPRPRRRSARALRGAPRSQLRASACSWRVTARELFAPLGPTYDRYASLLSFGQDPRWRRFLVSRVEAGPGTACWTSPPAPPRSRSSSRAGTAARSSASTRAPRCSRRAARASSAAGLANRIELVRGQGGGAAVRRRPSSTRSRFTYLLRYVDDPAADARRARTRRPPRRDDRVARVRRPCRGALPRAAWNLYVRRRPPARRRGSSRRAGARSASFLGPEHPRLLRAPSGSRAARALAQGRDRGRPRPPAEPRRRDRDLGPRRGRRGAAGLLRARARGLARLRHAAAPAVHGVAPELRRDRLRARPDAPRRPAARRARGVLPRAGGRRARARRAATAGRCGTTIPQPRR